MKNLQKLFAVALFALSFVFLSQVDTFARERLPVEIDANGFPVYVQGNVQELSDHFQDAQEFNEPGKYYELERLAVGPPNVKRLTIRFLPIDSVPYYYPAKVLYPVTNKAR